MTQSEDTVMNLNIDQNDLLDFEPSKPKRIDQDQVNTMTKNNIYSCYRNAPPLWEDVVDSINYIDLSKHSYRQMMYVLHDDVSNKTPKWMTVCCFDQVALTVPNKTILEGCNELIKLVEQEGLHKISFGTIQFPPEHQTKWVKIGELNAEIRLLNIDRKIPPLALHKALMKHMFPDNKGPLMVKGMMWQQYIKRTGLGETISDAGMSKLKHFLLQAVQKQFLSMSRKPSNRWLGTSQPPPLHSTEDYYSVETMCHFLREKGEFHAQKPTKSASTSSIQVKPRYNPVVLQPTGASADIDQNRPRPATWYGQNYQVDFQPLEDTRKVVLREEDDSAFDSVFVDQSEKTKRNYNERNDNDLRQSIEKLQSLHSQDKEFEVAKALAKAIKDNTEKEVIKTKTIEEDSSDLKKVKKENQDLKKEIAKLNKYLDTEEAENKDYKKQVNKLKLDNESLLLEKECLQNTQLKLDRELTTKTEQARLLEENYTFLKNLYDDRSAWIKKNKRKTKE